MEILKGNDMTTAEIINQAVKMINEHDFFWFYADYEATAREAARGHMAAFVELINKVSAEVREALKACGWHAMSGQRKTCLRLTEKH